MAANDVKIVLTAEDKTTGAFNSARKGLGNLAAEAKSVVSGVGAVGAAFGVLGGAVGAALSITAVKGAVDMLDQLDDLSEKTGIATEALSALRYAGEVVGTPIEALATGVRKLSLNMAAAAGGGKEQAAAFQAIGVSFKNLDGSLRGSDQVLGAIADKFASFRDGPEKAALAVDLFGKAGADMIPLLNKGSAGMEELRQEAERLGVVFSGDLAAQAAEFNDNLKKIQLSAQGFATTVAGELLPSLNELAGLFIEAQDGGNSFATLIGQGLKTALESVVVAGANVSFVLQGIGREIGAIGAQTVALATLDLKGFNVISEAVKSDAVRARAELDALERRILGIGTASFKDPRILGSVPSIKAQADALKAAAPVVQKLGETAKATGDELQKLLDKLQGKATGFDADYAKNINLLRTALDTGRLSWDAYTKAVGQYVAQQPASIEAAKAATNAMEEQAMAAYKLGRAELDEAESIDAWRKAQDEAAAASLKSINDRIAGLQLEEEATARAALENISLAAAIEQVTIDRLREQQAVLVAGRAAYDNVQKEIDARQKLIGIINTKDLRDKESAGWSQVFASIDSTAKDAWTNVWESGSDAFKRIGKTLKAAVLDVLYQMTVRPFIVKIGASVMGSGFATAANAATGSGTGVLSGAGNLASLFTGGTSVGNFAGSAFANLTGTGLDGLLATNAAFGTAASSGVSTVLSGLMTAAPYLAAVTAVYAIAKALDHSGTPHTGGGSSYSAASGLSSTTTSGWTGGSSSGDGFGGVMGSASTVEMTSGLVKSIVGILDSTATAFGKTAGYAAATSFADDSSKDPAWGSLVIKQLDNVLVNWNDTRTSKWAPRRFSDGSAGSAEYLAAISQDVRKAIDGIGLPAWASTMLNQLGEAPTLQQLGEAVALINKTQAVFTNLGQAMAGFATIGDVGRGRLVEAAGGIDALAASASAYYQAMYTEEEKAATVKRQYTEALQAVNLAVPSTIEAYRAQVAWHESIADTEPGAANVLATLYAMGPAFASVVPETQALVTVVDDLGNVTETVAEQVGRTAQDIAQSMQSLRDVGNDLRVDLLSAQGDSAGAQALRRALDTAGLTEAEIALYDYNQALRDQITAANAARDAADQARAAADDAARQAIADAQARAAGILQERTGLQDQLDNLTLTSAQLLEKQRNALDESNRALFDQVRAATDAAAAQQSLAEQTRQAESDAQARAAGILQERTGLQGQLDNLTLTSAQLLEKQRNALDESNRALFDQVRAATDAAAAQQSLAEQTRQAESDAQARAAGILQERTGLQGQLDNLTLTSAQLLEKQRNALDESNRALFDQVQAASAAAEAQQTLAEQTRLIASERAGLERQLLQQTGDIAALRALDLAALDPANRALQEHIWALEDQKKAADLAAAANADAADELQRAADAAAAAAQKIAGERDGLWRQWLTASGDTAALRELELAALDPSNRALQEQIWALQDQKTAADEAASAAEQLASTWGSLSESLMSEVARIRGLITDGSAGGFAGLQAQFAIATAQARALNQDAAQLLPGLSASLLETYAKSATSLTDLQRMQAFTANSLETTANIIGAATGTGTTATTLATRDGRTLTAMPVPAGQAGGAAGYSLADMVVELRAEIAALKTEVKGLRSDSTTQQESIAINTGKTARILDKFDIDGMPAVRA